MLENTLISRLRNSRPLITSVGSCYLCTRLHEEMASVLDPNSNFRLLYFFRTKDPPNPPLNHVLLIGGKCRDHNKKEKRRKSCYQ